MALANCTDCGKVFVKNSLEKVCPDCLLKRKEELDKIENWIKTSPQPILNNIGKDTGVSEFSFRKYLVEGRIRDYTKVYCNCEVCGQQTRIRSKNFICPDCSGSLKKQPAVPYSQPKKKLEQTKLYSKRKD